MRGERGEGGERRGGERREEERRGKRTQRGRREKEDGGIPRAQEGSQGPPLVIIDYRLLIGWLIDC